MLHPLEHVRDHQNPLADPPALASCQAPQLGRRRFAAKKVCRHTSSPKHGTLAHQLYHIWESPEAGITATETAETAKNNGFQRCRNASCSRSNRPPRRAEPT